MSGGEIFSKAYEPLLMLLLILIILMESSNTLACY